MFDKKKECACGVNKSITIFIFLLILVLPLRAQFTEDWARNYDGNYSGNDQATSVVVDGNGNVYVTGMADYSADMYTPITTVKYRSDGLKLWDVIYPPHQESHNYESEGNSMAIYTDGSNNTYIYVTGRAYFYGSDYDIVTLKYDVDGNRQWASTYNGSGNYRDYGMHIEVDGDGNAYVTGYSYENHSGRYDNDYFTMKYRSSDGGAMWDSPIIYDNGGDDKAMSLAYEPNNDLIYITGTSANSGTGNDIVTICYNSSGTQQWLARYDSGNDDSPDDEGNDIAVS